MVWKKNKKKTMLSIDRIDHIQYNKMKFLSSGHLFLAVFFFVFPFVAWSWKVLAAQCMLVTRSFDPID